MKYGIWNGMTKRFVFGIAEDTKGRAWRAFCKAAPDAARYWRYSVKAIPEGWKNPKNDNYNYKD